MSRGLRPGFWFGWCSDERLHINVFYSEEDGGYIADIPDLEYCSAFGDTPLRHLPAVTEAKEAWLAAARESGRPIPEPRYRPALYGG